MNLCKRLHCWNHTEDGLQVRDNHTVVESFIRGNGGSSLELLFAADFVVKHIITGSQDHSTVLFSLPEANQRLQKLFLKAAP